MRLKLAAMGSKSGVARTPCTRFNRASRSSKIGPAGGHAGADFIVGEAADIAEVVFDAVAHELAFERRRGFNSALHDDAHDALRGATQPEWISRSGGRHADLEAFGQRVPFVGEAQDSAGVRRWDFVFHAERLVVIVDRARDFFGFALRARVEAADDALKIGELFDHVGGEIALAQQRGSFIAAELLHQRDDALRFVVIRTQLGLEGDGLQVFQPRGQRFLLILIPEESRVVESRAQHALVALANQAVGIGSRCSSPR